jgi:hypothetical protein
LVTDAKFVTNQTNYATAINAAEAGIQHIADRATVPRTAISNSLSNTRHTQLMSTRRSAIINLSVESFYFNERYRLYKVH